MYSPLPESSGPVVTSRLAAPLRGALRLSSSLLGALALTLIASSVYMYIVYHRTGLNPPSPEPSPSPEPVFWGTRGGGHAYSLSAAAADGSPWFIYVVGGTGIYLLIASVAGISGTRLENRRRLFLHISMLAGGIVAEAAVLLFLFTSNDWKEKLPGDPSGFWDAVVDFIDKNSHVVKLSGLILIILQVVALGVASWLHAIHQAAYDDWVDGVEERQEAAQQLLARTVERSYAAQPGTTAWSLRIREKYGVGEKDWEEASRAVRQAAQLADDPAP